MQRHVTPSCPECGRSDYYYRQSTGEYVCKKCGASWPKAAPEAAR